VGKNRPSDFTLYPNQLSPLPLSHQTFKENHNLKEKQQTLKMQQTGLVEQLQ
jgi:hypothetical protein